MITVKELIERLQNEDPEAICLIQGYEDGFQYLRLKRIKRNCFNLPKGSDVDNYGGTIEPNKNGKYKCLIFNRVG